MLNGKQFFQCSFISLALVCSSRASDVGTTGANFLTIPLSVRAVGMGETYVALADDNGSLYWNPAGLSRLLRKQISFQYANYLQDVTFQHAAVGVPIENGSLGASLTYVGYGNFEAFGVDPSNNPIPIDSPHAQSSALSIGGAWNLSDRTSVGLAVKHIREKLADVSADTVAADLGVATEFSRSVLGGKLRTGVSFRHLGRGLRFLERRDPLPTDMRAGVALVGLLRNHLNTALDFGKRRDDKPSLNVGAEYWMVPQFAIRTGWSENRAEGLGIRAGMGVRIGSVSFDYSYGGFGNLGVTHRYELSFQFGDKRVLLTAEDKALLKEAKRLMEQGEYDRAFAIYDQLATRHPDYRDASEGMKLALNRMQERRLYMIADRNKQIDPTVNTTEEAEQLSLQDLLDAETSKVAEIVFPVTTPSEGLPR